MMNVVYVVAAVLQMVIVIVMVMWILAVDAVQLDLPVVMKLVALN